jgi:hypothetical protein
MGWGAARVAALHCAAPHAPAPCRQWRASAALSALSEWSSLCEVRLPMLCSRPSATTSARAACAASASASTSPAPGAGPAPRAARGARPR